MIGGGSGEEWKEESVKEKRAKVGVEEGNGVEERMGNNRGRVVGVRGKRQG